MPLPTPNTGEDRKDFMARCMGNPTMIKEYPNTDQRLAVCAVQYRKSKNLFINIFLLYLYNIKTII